MKRWLGFVLTSASLSLACADKDGPGLTDGGSTDTGEEGTGDETETGIATSTDTTGDESEESTGDETGMAETGTEETGIEPPEQNCDPPEYTTLTVDISGRMVALTAGDFDEDGFMDVVGVGGNQNGTMLHLRNDQMGGFEASEDALWYPPNDVVAGDFDGDDHLDLVVIGGVDATSFYRGLGDGSFEDGVSITDEEGYAVSAVDLDDDGNLDLVIGDFFTTFRSMMGNGDGTFGASTLHTDDERVRFHALADFDEDGELDILTSRGGLWLGAGDGTFVDNDGFDPIGQGDTAAAADIDADGHVDGINNDRESGSVIVALGDGAGGFAEPMMLASGDQPIPLLAFDTNGDWAADIVAGNRNDREVAVFVGNDCGLENGPALYDVGSGGAPPSGYPLGLAHADIDADGIDDILTANYNDNTVTFLLTGP